MRAGATFRQGAAHLIRATGADSRRYAEFLYWIWNGPRKPAERSEARPVGRSDVARCTFRGCEFQFLQICGVRVSEQKTLQVLELDPNFVPALVWLWKQCRWLIDGKLAEAIQIIEHAIALDPKEFIVASLRRGDDVSRPGRCRRRHAR